YWATDNRGFADNQMRRAAIHQYQLFGMMPIGDTPRMVGWWYHTDLATKQRWFGPQGGFDSEIGWGEYLEGLAAQVEKVERAATDTSRPITDTFPAKQSDEQIVPIINALVNDEAGLYQVNIPNQGHLIQELPEDLVIVCQGFVDGSGIHGVAELPLPPRLMAGAMIPRWHRAELMVKALQTGDRDLLTLYLLNDARTQSLEQAERLVDAWLSDSRNERIATIFR
ncbi:MAG: alpha-glucosidase/alpha-galactosidase, partial [Anaerolineae bacterium]|nr:alpha-glucosidase/alpha-galactosidase [Anaerolineae bacterium]